MILLFMICLFILKIAALGVFVLFFMEDLELTKSVGGVIYNVYFAAGIATFASLLFFILGKKFLWLIMFLAFGSGYLYMYNNAPGIASVHKSNNLKNRYFKDGETFTNRMKEVLSIINKEKSTSSTAKEES